MTGLLLETSLSAEQRSYAGAVDTSARSLLSIIDELLDAARADAGELTLTEGEVNLHDDVESIIELLAPRAHAKGIEVSCFVSPDLPRLVKGDAKRLGQVLLNIVGNAIKFTTNGGVLVTVKPGAAARPDHFRGARHRPRHSPARARYDLLTASYSRPSRSHRQRAELALDSPFRATSSG
jgi:signal transduction histidine kinase